MEKTEAGLKGPYIPDVYTVYNMQNNYAAVVRLPWRFSL